MKLSHLKVFSGAALALAAVVVSSPAKAGSITLINDSFNNVTLYSSTYQVQQALSGTVDSSFSTIDNSLNANCATGLSCVSNVDVLGSITPVPDLSVNYNMIPFESICATSGMVDCIDLNGTNGANGTSQGALQSVVNITTPGSVVLTSGILGASGYACSNPVTSTSTPATAAPCSNGSVDGTGRTTAASVLIVFGTSSCFTNETSVSAYQSNGNCLYVNSVTPATVNTVANQTSSSINVGTGTYYVEYLSETSGNVGDLLTSVNLTETTAPEPSTMILLGTALLGLGAARFRKRQS